MSPVVFRESEPPPERRIPARQHGVHFICSFCKRVHDCPANPDCHWSPKDHEGEPPGAHATFNPDHSQIVIGNG